MPRFYLTTTLPYVNAQPHIGHALEFIQADVICRRRRSQGDDVLFNVGTDEHGLKIFEKATEAGMDVQSFVDMNVQTFYEFCERFEISYDNFYRTSDPSHRAVAQTMWQRCLANGDIYKKQYAGLYCVGCESFKTPKDLVDGICPDHGKVPVQFEQENYFFRLSNYREPLKNYFTSHQALLPENKLSELLNFIDTMEDISISRTKESLPRGVPVPDDPAQVMYVWFDALSNYIGAVGFPDALEEATKRQATCVQIFWPDNLRFQCAIWQAMLLSAWLPCTKTLLMHGMVLGPDGNKMSKTLGNVISPLDQCEQYGTEAVRLYLIAGMPTFGDSAYKEDDLINLYNAHLANAFGNLLSRVIQLANKKEILLTEGTRSPEVQATIDTHHQAASSAYDNFSLYEATTHIHALAQRANKYMDDHKPREKTHSFEYVQQVLYDLWQLCATLIDLYSPVIPHSCALARTMLDTQEKAVLFPKIECTTI